MTQALTRRTFMAGLGGVGAGLLTRGSAAGESRPDSAGVVQEATGAADWPRFGYDLQNTRFNSREKTLGPRNVERLKVKWKADVQGPIQTTPTVVGNTLFVGSEAGNEHAFDARTGEFKWKSEYETNSVKPYGRRGVRSSGHYSNGRMYFGDGGTWVHCVEAVSGKEIWRTRLTDDPTAQTRCSPAVFNGKVNIGYSSDVGNAEIVCLDAETGAVCWRFKTAPEGGGGSIWSSPAIDEKEQIVYNATGSVKGFLPAGPMLYTESIVAHDLNSGELLWYDQVRRASPHDLDFGCHPMIFDAQAPSGYRGGVIKHCVAAGNKGGLVSWDRYTGERNWNVMLTPASGSGGFAQDGTAVAYNKIYGVSKAATSRGVGSVAAALHAYTGDIMWWVPNQANCFAPVAVANGVFYQGLIDGTLEALDAETGRSLWQFQLPSAHRGGISIANGVLFASTGEPSGTPEEVAKGKTYSVYAFSVDGK